ncbi:hypothetical protein GGI19_000423 [Coemansia pectinata]|uniref:Fungal lipase-type domain-containing protein n=1 Tax=Coemansia pectinata TaxID=1052879 RepID=A0A9W8LD59_9FUNG|nr:hypothetical protein GGI19_000423 [Coemansia pectinata]
MLTGGGSATRNIAIPDMDSTLLLPDTPIVPQDTLDLYAAYSGAAYNISDNWNCGTECQHPGTEGTTVIYHRNNDTFSSVGFIATNANNKNIIVSFRGTAGLGDWLENYLLDPIDWLENINGFSVVSGFLTGYLVVSVEVVQIVVDLSTKFPDYKIVATGHSLGGSRAALFVADMTTKYPNIASQMKLFTYGQAKCGNKVFAKYMDSLGIRIFREVNKGDIVPHLPWDITQYVHFGTEAWVDFSGKAMFCKSGNYSHCSAGISPLSYSFVDHTTYKDL